MRAIAANEGRYPISAQCRLLGVAGSTYHFMCSRAHRPAAPAVAAAHAASKSRYGSRKIKASLGRPGVTVIRRRALPHYEGERPDQCIRQEEDQGAARGGQRGRRAECRSARRGPVEPRLPARPPRDVRHDARAPGQALGLRAPVRQLQDPLDAGLHVAGRVQGGGAVPPGIVQIGVANPVR